ncbi:MAG TPA: tail tape measure protein [Allosphingosinicella sp.]|jgi:phage-related minor tail protein
MDEEIERLVVSVRADTTTFAKDVAAMRAELDGPFADGVERAGRVLENALVRALRTGGLGFEDLKRIALSAMAEIAAASIRAGIGAMLGGGGKGAGATLGSLLASALGAPGKAIGGPVSAARPYLVGERGPELFVPTGSGRIEPMRGGGGARDVRLSITVNAPPGTEPQALHASSRQVARAVRAALMRVED